jgi:GAF domain-containing protein/signal transduction histidine kinase
MKDVEKVKRLEKLSEATRLILSNLGTMSLDEQLNCIAKYATEILEAQGCEVLLIRREGFLSLEASYGSREGSFQKGLEFPIRSGIASGLTGHIAFKGELFNAHGAELVNHFASSSGKSEITPTQTCTSLLAVPLKKKSGDDERLIGLLRVSNKKGPDGHAHLTFGFNEEDEWLINIFADHVSAAIESAALVTELGEQKQHLSRLYEEAEHRRHLLMTLDETARWIRGEREEPKLRQEVVRLAVELVGGSAGALFLNYPQLAAVESSATYHLQVKPNLYLPHGEGLVGRVARTGKSEVAYSPAEQTDFPGLSLSDFNIAIAVPLKSAIGAVESVLLVLDEGGQRKFAEANVEVLERFAAQASIAIQSSSLMSHEQRMFSQLNILPRIMDYILAERDLDKILHAVLTGITAGYGLGFNRAALLLLDEREEFLVGRTGIGHLSRPEPIAAWETDQAHGVSDFAAYLDQSKRTGLPPSPIGDWITTLRFPLSGDDIFSRVIQENRLFLIKANELGKFPASFMRGFQPTSEVIIIPLATSEKSIGLLLADNKFTRSPIISTDVEALLAFAKTAAIAIDRLRLFERVHKNNDYLRMLFAASNALSANAQTTEVLERVLELMRKVSGAAWARIILIDERGHARETFAVGTQTSNSVESMFRPDGIGMRVMRTGVPISFEDAGQWRDQINPVLLGDEPQQALLCLPLSMQGRIFGVVWLSFDGQRSFNSFEVEALQLFVNQAAVAYDSARRMEELEQMRRAAEALAAEEDPRGVLEQIVSGAQVALQADSAAIWTYDDVRNSFNPDGRIGSGISPEIAEPFWKVQPRSGGTTHTIMQEGLIGVEDIQDETFHPYLGNSTRTLLSRLGVQSFLGLSLTVGDEKLGVLYVNYKQPRSFSEEEKGTAHTFANHAALALKKAKLLEQVRKAKRAAEAVAMVTALGDRAKTLKAITVETQRALDCDAVVLYEYDRSTHTLRHPPTTTGVRNEQMTGMLDQVGRDSIVYRVLERDELIVVEDTDESPLFRDRRFTREEGIKSAVAVPLKVGVLFINYRTRHRFTSDEIGDIELFANQAAVAIRNAQLYESLGRQLDSQRELFSLSQKLLGTLTPEETMEAAVAVAGELLGVEMCAIALQDDASDAFVPVAAYGWDPAIINAMKFPRLSSQTGYTIMLRSPVIVEDFQSETRFEVPAIITELKIRSGLSVPMFDGDDLIGAMLIHTKTHRHFSEEDGSLLSLVANQTAIAVQRARQYKSSERKGAYLDALYEASKALTASFDLDRKELLIRIVREAVNSLTATGGSRAILGTLQLYDVETNELVFESVYPPEQYPTLVERIGERMALDPGSSRGGRIGVQGRTLQSGQSQLVQDVMMDADYVMFNPATRSELAVPLRSEAKIIGVLSVESPQVSGFDEGDMNTLETLADFAVLVIRNAEQYQMLRQTKGLVGSRTALAWMGMMSSTWMHSIAGNTTNILNTITLLRQRLKSADTESSLEAMVEEHLARIEVEGRDIIDKPITPPLSSEEGLIPVPINEFIRERTRQLRMTGVYESVECGLRLEAGEETTILISPEWLQRVLDILIENAVKALRDVPGEKRILITTWQGERRLEIAVADTGKGISASTLQNIFFLPIQGRAGLGLGLLMAQAIVQTYGGDIHVKETGPAGTTMVISLPLEPGVALDRSTSGAFEIERLYDELKRAYEELKELDRKKTEFLSNVSHELRTPLTPVRAFIENLLDGIYEPLNPAQRVAVEFMNTYVSREIQLVEKLLELARIQENKVKLDLACESLTEIVHDVVNDYRHPITRGDILLKEELPTDDPLEVLADASRIKQVIGNLITNAFKFTHSGSITIKAERRGSEALVSVRDTGPGIAKEHLPRIFDRFYQVDSSTRGKAPGTGIGLNIAKEFVEMHGGRIWVESELDKGSRFWFALPGLNGEEGPSG